jgi:16S rRNA (guanine(966)-N(2))-methyltransferase RsmD
MRETLFNVLAPEIPGVTFVDAYAGTGAVGIEALSRGASRAVLIEQNRAAIGVIRSNLKSLGIEDRAEVRQGRATACLPLVGGHIIFLDPPYDMDREYEAALTIAAGGSARLVIAQHDVRLKLKDSYGTLQCSRVLKQGDNLLSFFAR